MSIQETIKEWKEYNIFITQKAEILNPCCNHHVDLMYKEGLRLLEKLA